MKIPFTIRLLSVAFVALLTPIQNVFSQGCVAIRSVNSNTSVQGSSLLDKGDMQFGLGYRFFHSYKHFRGPHEEVDRVDEGSDVRNDVNTLDILYSIGITKQWSATLDVPVTSNWRSSLYEHGSAPNGEDVRRPTSSFGLNDIRLQFDRWMIDTYKPNSVGNFSLGAGIKFPTGNPVVQDTFYFSGDEGENEYREVDQSIQLGDGGWGFSLQSQGYTKLESDRLFAYYSIYYLFNPQDTLSWEKKLSLLEEGSTPTVNFSIADQWLSRFGFTYLPSSVQGLATSLGFRYEGIPVEDVFGETNGRRRPGMVLSVDPGVTYETNHHLFSLNVPIAVYRNRTQSVSDIERQQTEPSDPPRHGDAAFSDYTIFLSYSYKLFNKKNHGMMEDVTPVE